MYRAGFGRLASIDSDTTPVGINVAIGATAIALATFLATRFPASEVAWQDTILAGTVCALAAYTLDRAAMALLLAPTWMIMNGFLVNRSGDLSWHGPADLYRFLLLIGAAGLGLVAGETFGRVRDLRERWQLGAIAQAMSTEFDEERHRA